MPTSPINMSRVPSRRAVLLASAATAVGGAGAVAAGQAFADPATDDDQHSPIWSKGDVVLLLIDYQPQTFESIQEADAQLIELNARFLARAAVTLDVPVVLSTVGVKAGINDPTITSLREELPGVEEIDRSTMDAWDDPSFRKAAKSTERSKLIVAGLYSEICVTYPTVHAIKDGYEVAFIADAIAGLSLTAHKTAIRRMTHAGAVPSTAMAMVLEWFRDWGSPEASAIAPVLRWYDEEIAAIRS